MIKNKFHFKPLKKEDLEILHNWFQIPHVKTGYARNKTYTLNAIKQKYLPRIKDPEKIANFIIQYDNKSIGYIQLYHLDAHLPEGVPDYDHPLFKRFNPKEIAGVDIFIANTDFLHKGYGTKALTVFINDYLQGDFSAVVVDPMKNNQIVINFFKRIGFEEIESNKTSQNALLLLKLTEAGIRL